jgi:hypothetical protein
MAIPTKPVVSAGAPHESSSLELGGYQFSERAYLGRPETFNPEAGQKARRPTTSSYEGGGTRFK